MGCASLRISLPAVMRRAPSDATNGKKWQVSNQIGRFSVAFGSPGRLLSFLNRCQENSNGELSNPERTSLACARGGKPTKRALKNSFTTNFINPHEILPAEVIAAKVFEALILPKPKVRYTLAPDPMRQVMAALLPKRTLDGIIAKRLGLMPRA